MTTGHGLSPIDTIVFDMDGVLTRSHRHRRLELLAGWSGRDPAEIDRVIFQSTFEEEAECGLWSPDDYLREVGDRLGYRLTVGQWIEARRATTEPRSEVLVVARALSEARRVALFTNNPLLLKRHLRSVFPEAAALFADRAVCSAELGRRKPEPEAFLLLAARLDTTPGAVLFVDDDPRYVEGARRAGMRAEVFVDLPQLLADLRAHGIDAPGLRPAG